MALRTYTFRLGDLPKLDLQVDRGTDFKAWKAQWSAYFNLSGLNTQTAAKQVQALTLCFSRETVTIVDNLGLSEDQRASVNDIIAAIEAYVQGQINETVERRNFRRRVQQDGETFDDFLVSLRELAKTCNFCDQNCANNNLRDQIVAGLADANTVEDLLKEKNLSLNTAISKCQASEAAKKQRAEITSQAGTAVQRVRQPPSGTAAQNTKPTCPGCGQDDTTTQNTKPTCPGCGSSFHPGGRRQCPAFQAKCHKCNRTGHFAKFCRSRKAANPSPTATGDASANAIRVSLVPTKSAAPRDPSVKPAPTIQAHFSSLNGAAELTALPDSGADISVAGPNTVMALKEHLNNLLPSQVTPRTVSGHTMSPLGKLPVTVSVGGNTYKDDIHIYPQIDGILLSWRTCIGLGILPQHYPQPAIKTVQVRHETTPPSSGQATSQDLMEEFPTVFTEQVKAMEGESFRIELTDDAKPFCVKTPRAIPFAYREKLRSELETLQNQNIITPVTHPTEWCAPIVVTPKKDSEDIRMCVDLSHLNRYVKRERYHSATPAQAVADITAEKAQVFTKMDARKGYHQCPLDQQSQDLTTFITPFGRFKFLRAPYGISSISEHYNRRMDEAFAGLPGYRRVVDDIVIYDQDKEHHTDHVKQFLRRCDEKGITLNKSKWAFAQSSVTFAGFRLSAEGYQIDTSITQAIVDFPSPSNRTDLRSFVGLVNQLSSSTSTIATILAPLRPLLSTKNEFIWSEESEQAFNSIKKSLTTAPTLSYFDFTRKTRLCTDASRQGIGFILQQKSGDSWSLIQAGSRFLSDAESRYAIIELELLAVTWAITKCHLFLAGLPHFLVITDHHPLVPILNNHRLDEIENPRLQRLKTKVMGYNFTAEWMKGALNCAPDALSRNPTTDPLPQDMLGEIEIDNSKALPLAEIRAVRSSQTEALRMHNLKQIAGEDPVYQKVKHYILNGFPAHRQQLPDDCRAFWSVRAHLTVEDNLILYGCRLVIPSKMRRQILHQLHASHQGIVRTRERAQLAVYWPGMSNDIDNTISSCQQCQDSLPSNPKEPILHKPRPTRPFQEVAADFCYYAGQQYLIVVDSYTDWPDILPMKTNTTAKHLIKTLRGCFCRTGVPDKLWSDQGPQFSSKAFQDFLQQWGVEHVTSSPRYPQSNGKAEATVKSMKKLIKASWNGRTMDDDKLTQALLQYRNTPSRKDRMSPAQKLFGHPIQDTLPAHRKAFLPEWQRSSADAEKHAKASQEKVEKAYNQHARPLPLITVGSNVAIQNHNTKMWDTYGIVTEIGPHRRYFIKTHGGRVLVRNRRFIRRRVPITPIDATPVAPLAGPPVAPPAPPPAPQRRSLRPHKRPKRLIEEIRSFRAPESLDSEAPGGGDVGN